MKKIRDLLLFYKLIHPIETLTVTIRTQGNWGITVFTSLDKSFHIKISIKADLFEEFYKLKFAYSKHANFMARPLICCNFEGKNWIISEGVLHSHFPRFINHLNTSHYFSIFDYFFNAINVADKTYRKGVSIDNLILWQRQGDLNIQDVSKIYAIINTIPLIYQHGDFTANNLGWSMGKIVVFDWEDYAQVGLPGFDFICLLASLCQFETDILYQIIMHNRLVRQFVNIYSVHIGCDYQSFIALIPVYLLLFRELKNARGYGADVIQRVNKAIKQASLMETQYA